jgi:hypothetical protein
MRILFLVLEISHLRCLEGDDRKDRENIGNSAYRHEMLSRGNTIHMNSEPLWKSEIFNNSTQTYVSKCVYIYPEPAQ